MVIIHCIGILLIKHLTDSFNYSPIRLRLLRLTLIILLRNVIDAIISRICNYMKGYIDAVNVV